MTNHYELSYEELRNFINTISPHQRCLISLMTELYKCLNGLSPDIINDVLAVSKHRYNTQNSNLFVTDPLKSDIYSQNSISYTANQVWNLLPREIKKSASLDSIKLKNKKMVLRRMPLYLM